MTLRSSDAFVVQYRQWLDAVGHGMPWAVGWRTATARPLAAVPHVSLPGHRASWSRLERHVLLSRSSRAALARAAAIKKGALAGFACLAAAAYPLAAAAISVRARLLAAAATLGAAAIAAAAAAVERSFHENYVRHPR